MYTHDDDPFFEGDTDRRSFPLDDLGDGEGDGCHERPDSDVDGPCLENQPCSFDDEQISEVLTYNDIAKAVG